MLHLKAAGAPVTDSMMRMMMRGHEPRHYTYVIIRLFRLTLTLLASAVEAPNADAAERAVSHAKEALEAMVDDRPYPEQQRDVTIMEWWRDAEARKQAGLYVDYVGEGHWATPDDLGPAAYAVAAEVVGVELADAKQLMEAIYAVPADLQTSWKRALEGL